MWTFFDSMSYCSHCYLKKRRIVGFVVFQLSEKADHLVLVESSLLIPNTGCQFVELKFEVLEVLQVFLLVTLHL